MQIGYKENLHANSNGTTGCSPNALHKSKNRAYGRRGCLQQGQRLKIMLCMQALVFGRGPPPRGDAEPEYVLPVIFCESVNIGRSQ